MNKSKAMRNIFLYIAIIMVCMFFLGFFTAKRAYAAEDDDIYSDVPAPPLESNETYFLREHLSSSSYLRAYVFNVNDNVNNLGVPVYHINQNGKHLIVLNAVKIYEWRNNTWVIHSTHHSGFGGVSTNQDLKYINLDMLSVPIYTAKEIDGVFELTGEVFFYPASRLSRLMERVEMTGVMEQVVFLIPISLGLLVSLMGLRKALAMLLTMLKRA